MSKITNLDYFLGNKDKCWNALQVYLATYGLRKNNRNILRTKQFGNGTE